MLCLKKNLIFDLGGVLLDLHVDRAFGALLALGADRALLTEEACLLNDTMQKYDRGEISTDDFFAYIASHLPRQVRDLPSDELRSRIHDIWNMMLGGCSPAKTECLERLRAKGHRLFLLSNTNEGHWDAIERELFKACGKSSEEIFDGVYLSYRMRLRKPEEAIFDCLLRNEGVDAADCMFFDDLQENCDAAAGVGIEAVLMERNAPWPDFLMKCDGDNNRY